MAGARTHRRALAGPAWLAFLALAASARAGEPPAKVDPNCTDGYQVVCEGLVQVQTFKAGAEKLDAVRFRAARTHDHPAGDLVVELREPGKEAPLTRGAVYTDSPTRGPLPPGAKPANVTRFYRWMTVEIKAAGLEKGRTYELVFSSPKSVKGAPWLVNCFYRDAYPDGEHRQAEDGKAGKPDGFDLVFEATSGEDKVASAPAGTDLSRKDEHYGVGPDGGDLKRPGDGVDDRGAFF